MRWLERAASGAGVLRSVYLCQESPDVPVELRGSKTAPSDTLLASGTVPAGESGDICAVALTLTEEGKRAAGSSEPVTVSLVHATPFVTDTTFHLAPG